MSLNSQAPNLFYAFALQVIVLACAIVVGTAVYALLGPGRRNKPGPGK
jgi:hypothetical protein